MLEIKYYDWVPFFKDLCQKILEISSSENRDYKLYLKALEIFAETDAIIKFQYIDPFSFIYALAQKNTINQLNPYYSRTISAFGLTASVPTDLIFPTPIPQTKTLFYARGEYIDNAGNPIDKNKLWNLFEAVFFNRNIDNDDFRTVLSIKNVGVVKLTQTMFLINPEDFIPFDTQMNSLPIMELENLQPVISEIMVSGYGPYKKVIELLYDSFPGCKLYEVNLLNALINSPDHFYLPISSTYLQISSNANGRDEGDYYEQFKQNNAVWTGGPAGETGAQVYNLTGFDRGDVVLIRRGTKRLGGIGIILQNGYIPNGFHEDAEIKIVWLVKLDRKSNDQPLGQRIGFAEASDLTFFRFQEQYGRTFNILDYLRNKQRTMINHTLNTHKNIILTGPPGTGKTRKALQIAQWLTTGTDHSLTLMDAIDKNIFQGEPNIEDIHEAELIQFHPSYSYEDFVRGISTTTEGEHLVYKVENKCLARMALEASLPENLHKAYVLIIDEINRANLSTVLGELIYALEYRGKAVHTLYSFEGSDTLVLPDNLYIIGTMNTADRSVGHIDYAIRRRFSFVPVPSDISAIKNAKAQALYKKISDIFDTYITSDFNKDDVKIGHSYFLGDDSSLAYKLKYDIRPILYEYLRDGVLMDTARQIIKDLHE